MKNRVVKQVQQVLERLKNADPPPATTGEIRRFLGEISDAIHEINLTNELKNVRNQKTWDLARRIPEFIKRVR